MTDSKTKSRTFRRKEKITPGNRKMLHFARKSPKKAVCGSCGTVLKGISARNPISFKKLPKSQRRPQRAFGGVLCSRCARATIKAKARS